MQVWLAQTCLPGRNGKHVRPQTSPCKEDSALSPVSCSAHAANLTLTPLSPALRLTFPCTLTNSHMPASALNSRLTPAFLTHPCSPASPWHTLLTPAHYLISAHHLQPCTLASPLQSASPMHTHLTPEYLIHPRALNPAGLTLLPKHPVPPCIACSTLSTRLTPENCTCLTPAHYTYAFTLSSFLSLSMAPLGHWTPHLMPALSFIPAYSVPPRTLPLAPHTAPMFLCFGYSHWKVIGPIGNRSSYQVYVRSWSRC